MSRHPSPGPSYATPHASQQIELATLYHSPAVLANPGFQQKRNRAIMGGITAGVEDAKYQAKYKHLKRTVKEIEADNDRLYFKLLLAKKNIRRMNLERAILYERLAAVPPTPGRHTQELPPEQDPIFHHLPPLPPEHARFIDPNDPAIAEYMRTRPEARIVLGPDDRVVAIEDILPAPPPGQEARPVPPPHGVPLVYGFRHDSGPGYDPERQMPPLPPMIPVIPATADSAREMASADHHAVPYPAAQTHAHVHPQSHSHGGSSHHSRSNSTRPDLDALSVGGVVPQGHAMHTRSPPMAGPEGHNDRSRRHEAPELAHPHGHPIPMPHPHVQIPAQTMPASPHSHSPASTRASDRSSGRIHNHQRVGPGANIHRDRELSQREWEQREYERELERERERERERELAYRQRLELEEQEEASVAYMRDNGRVAPAVSHGGSRSGTPNSGPGNGGSRVPSRPDSGQSVAYDAEKARPRVSNLLGIDRDPVYDDRASASAARGNAAEMSTASTDTRRRYRGDADANEEYGGEIRSPVEGSRTSSGQANPLTDATGKRRRSTDDDGDPGSDTADDRMDEDA